MSASQLKSVAIVPDGSRVLVYSHAHQRLELSDPDGGITQLLRLLAEEGGTARRLARKLRRLGHPVSERDVEVCLASLDGLGLLQPRETGPHARGQHSDRHESNLRYYELFASRQRSARDIHSSVARSRILLLGAGGAGSGILQALVGAGVPWVRIVDFDVVESKNLARQFCYSETDIGRLKVEAAAEWVRGYSAGTVVDPVVARISTAREVQDLAVGADVVICAIDTPADAQLIVNDACMALGIPFVTGGLQQSTLYYWSVEPGVSPCRMCLELHRHDALAAHDAALASPLMLASRVNRGTGPVAQLLSGFMALEALRYVARHDHPVASARYRWIGLADSMKTASDAWDFHPDCPYCSPKQTAAPRRSRPSEDR